MKRLLPSLIIILSLNSFTSSFAQEVSNTKAFKKHHALYDYLKSELTSTDTISGFNKQLEKLKISGTIFEADGVTPAKNVILYICQADEDGYYHSKKVNGKRTLRHQAWVKTDNNGRYTFYTFLPGTIWGTKALKQIHGFVKKPNSTNVSAINHFVFDNDPFLRKSCRKKIAKRGIKNILKLEKKNGFLVGKRDIVL